MKKRILILIAFLPLLLNSNMASPVIEGTFGTRPFINEFVTVNHENLDIKIATDFKYADYQIEYHITSEKDGLDIPLLFYASEYYNDFEVKIDGRKIELKKIEELWNLYKDTDKEKFNDFSYLFEYDRETIATIPGGHQNGMFDIFAENFLYFETNISKGKHIINVNYRASRWKYKSSNLNEYSFRYALSPAKYWKSFGTLAIKIDATDFNKEITHNLGSKFKGDLNGISNYHFTEMPTEIVVINFIPKVNKITQFLIDVNVFRIAALFTLLFVVFHILRMKKFRKKNQNRFVSVTALIGGLIIPIIFVISLILFGLMLESMIGEHASGRQSYGLFFSIFFLPKYLLIYLVFSLVIDFGLKKHFQKKQRHHS